MHPTEDLVRTTKQAYLKACGIASQAKQARESCREQWRKAAHAQTDGLKAEVARLQAALEAALAQTDGFKAEIARLQARSASRIAWIQAILDADRAQALDRDRRTAGLMAASRAAASAA